MKISDLRSELILFLADVEQGQGRKSTAKASNPVLPPAPVRQCQTVVSAAASLSSAYYLHMYCCIINSSNALSYYLNTQHVLGSSRKNIDFLITISILFLIYDK